MLEREKIKRLKVMNKEIGEKWLKQAFHDLEMAEKNIEIKGYDIASFLAHQSIEKLLKAILAFEGKKIPKIHYLDELIKNFDVSEEILNDITDFANDYFFSRYPDVADNVPYEEYNEDIAKDKIEK